MSASRSRWVIPGGGGLSTAAILLSAVLACAGGEDLEVLARSPAANSHLASPTETISITFDRTINPQTVSPQSFAVHAMQSGLLQKTLRVAGGQVALAPRSYLHCGERVQVSATRDIRDASGAGPALPTVWQFQVAALGGTGSFAVSSAVLGGVSARAIAIGDVDGDGDLDAFVGNENSANGIAFNDGFGNFTASGQSLGSSNTLAVALGDMDGDGDLDAFVANEGGANKVWLNNGSGSFWDSGQNLGNSNSRAVSLGDVDGDGDLDAVVANEPGGAKVWFNLEGGLFVSGGQSLGAVSSRAVALGDADGDGDLDAFVAGQGQANRVWFNDGWGVFADWGRTLGSENAQNLALGDLDHDGDVDAVVGYETPPGRIWLNDGSGRFVDSGESLGTSGARTLAVGDFNGDGALDVFAGNRGGDNRVWFNDGSATFQSGTQSLGSSDSRVLALSDLEGDGDVDLLIGYEGGANTIWLNQAPAVPPGLLRLTGPTYGLAGLAYAVTATVSPFTTTRPILYTWRVTDHAGRTAPGALEEVFQCRWDRSGKKTVTVEVNNDWGRLSVTHSVWVARPGDIDADGVIDASDPLLFSLWWQKSSEEQKALGDPTQDGQVNLEDLLWLLESWKE